MSQDEGFTGGFLVGTVVGGLLGGIVGALVASQRLAQTGEAESSLLNSTEAKASKPKRRLTEDADRIEGSRRSLEDKIAQLNAAIDEVRLSLGNVNGNVLETDKERGGEPGGGAARTLAQEP